MTNSAKLILVKMLHTLIWLFFNVVIFYMLYAVIVDRIDRWFWTGLIFVALEALVLLVFKNICPVTIMARKYSSSLRPNFDIYLPAWLARHNKLIYSMIVSIIICVLIYRLIG
jgi:hypothetical protein